MIQSFIFAVAILSACARPLALKVGLSGNSFAMPFVDAKYILRLNCPSMGGNDGRDHAEL